MASASWNTNFLPLSSEWCACTYGKGAFIAISSTSKTAAYSEDAINWKTISLPFTCKMVTFGGDKFVAVSNAGQVACSSDGVNWKSTASLGSSYWSAITYGAGKFVAIREFGSLAYSSDGVAWEIIDLPSSLNAPKAIAYGNGKFVIVSSGNGTAAYSSDGINWKTSYMPLTVYWNSIAFGNGAFVASAGGSYEGAQESDFVAYSKDGISWKLYDLPKYAVWSAVTYGYDRFVIVSYGNNLAADSVNGINWTEGKLPYAEKWTDVSYGAGRFFAISDPNKVCCSHINGLYISIITLDPNGGACDVPRKETLPNGEIGSLPTPTRSGYTFSGWYTSKTGGTKVTESTVFLYNTTIYARWTAKAYTVTWNASTNGGTVNGKNYVTTTVNGGDTATPPSYTPVKTGNTFKNWYTTSTGSTLYSSVTITGNRTFYAQFNLNVYKITWDANGGSPNKTTNQTYSKNLVLPSSNPTREGYNFLGWYTASSGGTKVTSSTVYNTLGPTTYYAHWERKTYTVTWNASENGGKVNGQNYVTTTVNSGDTATPPNYTPTKTGSTFKNWYTTSTGSTLYSTVTITGNRTFYAQFNLNRYTVTWDANGGSPDKTTTQTYSQKLVLPSSNPTRAGYTFAGWFTAASGGTQVTSSTVYNILGPTTYYAQWKADIYTITFDPNGGFCFASELDTKVGGTLPWLPIPGRTGYEFAGWFTAKTGGTEVTTNTVFTSDSTIFARWTPSIYTITWDSAGGNPASSTTQQQYDSKIILPEEPQRTGYTFDGWYTSDGTEVTPYDTYTTPEDTTYYARWIADLYITFYANGGEVYGGVSVGFGVGYGETVEILPTASREGYIFDGWFTEPTGGTRFTVETIVTSNMSVYAHWTQELIFSVSFDATGGTASESVMVTGADGKLPSLPTAERNGYFFVGWYTERLGGTKIKTSTVFSEDSTVYAHWTAEQTVYTITFNGNGGAPSASSLKTNIDGTLDDFPTAERPGYRFDGWFTSRAGGAQVSFDTVYTSDTTLYAHWTPEPEKEVEYTITFDANGGVCSIVSWVTDADGRLPFLPDEESGDISREGYTLKGWYTKATGGVQVTTSTVFKSDTTIYAHWTTKPTYTITLNATGGTVSPSKKETDEAGRITSLPMPERTGYYFSGWYTARSGGTRVTENTVFKKDQTIYAHWTPKQYQATFFGNGGTPEISYAKQSFGEKMNFPQEPVREGYAFQGWYLSVKGGDKITEETTYLYPFQQTYYAHWISPPSPPSPMTYDKTSFLAGYTVGRQVKGWCYSSAASQLFKGYFLEFEFYAGAFFAADKFQGAVSSFEYPNAYAGTFPAPPYEITFDPNGGTCATESMTILSDGTLSHLPAAYRDGYTLQGWYRSKSSGGKEVTTETVFIADTTVYAHWIKE